MAKLKLLQLLLFFIAVAALCALGVCWSTNHFNLSTLTQCVLGAITIVALTICYFIKKKELKQ